MKQLRPDGRSANMLRPIAMIPGVSPYAEGSCEVSFGKTRVLCTASLEKDIPKWMSPSCETGWITAEYGMLPRATHTRNKREAASGRQGGRTLEIQRLIGRALRQAVDLKLIKGLSVRIDCDVICADGGTRTASISGAWVALFQALHKAVELKLISKMPRLKHVAAISAGRVGNAFCLDLNYEEDSHADFDLNVVLNEEGNIIEIQGTGEKGTLEEEKLHKLLQLAKKGIYKIIEYQRDALKLNKLHRKRTCIRSIE